MHAEQGRFGAPTARGLRADARALVAAALLGLGCAGPKSAPLVPTEDADAFRRVVPAPGPVPVIQEPSPAVLVSSSGFRTLSVQWEAGTVALELNCRLGTASDPEGRSGVTSLLARMLTEGTRERTALEQAVAFEELGANLDADVGPDSLSLSTEVLPADLPRAIELLGESLLAPGLREPDFLRVRKERLDDLQAQRQDPSQLSWLLATRALLGPSRGRPGSGRPSDVEKLEVAHLKERHGRLAPENCALLAAGSFDPSLLESSVMATFSAWRTGAPRLEAPPAPSPSHLGEVVFLERDEAVQTAIVMASLAPHRLVPGYEARELVNDAFGGLFTSRLNTNLRERNAFTYGASSFLYATRDVGAFMLSSSVHAEVTGPALLEMRKELARLAAEPPTADELARARADLIQQRRARLEHVSRLRADIAEAFTLDLPVEYSATYPARLVSLDESLLTAAARELSQGEFVTVVVGAKGVGEALSAAGFSVVAADAGWLL